MVSSRRIHSVVIALLCALALCSAEGGGTITSSSSTAPSDNNSTTSSPTPTALAPVATPTSSQEPTANNSTNHSASPSSSLAPTPTNVTTPNPSQSPTTKVTPTPTPAPTNRETPSPTHAPTKKPSTEAPTTAPTQHHKKKHRPSLWRILGKTLVWLILIGFSVLLFGAVMSNRYRIYYYLRGAWYTFLGWHGTQWVIRKLRLERFFGGNRDSLNEIIFDNDLNEGLLLQDT